jgi:TetR/AcrR family transcriptional regulator
MRGDARRQQLIDIALHLFATRGFRGATTRAIAGAAGVSEAMLFRHFPTKDDLYRAIIQVKSSRNDLDRTLEALRRSMAAGDDRAVVRQLAEKTLETYERDRDYQRVMMLAALEGHDLASLSRDTLGLPIFALLRDYVVRRQAAGAFRPGDPALQAFSLVALPVYYAIVTRLFGIDLRGPNAAETAAVVSELILDGLHARPERLSRPRKRRSS